MWFRFEGFGFRVSGFGFRVGLKLQGLGCTAAEGGDVAWKTGGPSGGGSGFEYARKLPVWRP